MPTTDYDVTSADWQLVGAAPCLVQAPQSGPILLHVGISKPALNTRAYHVLNASYGEAFAVTAPGQSVWARTQGAPNVVSVSPVATADAAASATYGSTPLLYQQVTNLSASTPLFGVPADALAAVVIVEGAGVRLRKDGTAPTASVGMPIPPGGQVRLYGPEIAAVRFIQQTAGAVLNVEYGR